MPDRRESGDDDESSPFRLGRMIDRQFRHDGNARPSLQDFNEDESPRPRRITCWSLVQLCFVLVGFLMFWRSVEWTESEETDHGGGLFDINEMTVVLDKSLSPSEGSSATNHMRTSSPSLRNLQPTVQSSSPLSRTLAPTTQSSSPSSRTLAPTTQSSSPSSPTLVPSSQTSAPLTKSPSNPTDLQFTLSPNDFDKTVAGTVSKSPSSGQTPRPTNVPITVRPTTILPVKTQFSDREYPRFSAFLDDYIKFHNEHTSGKRPDAKVVRFVCYSLGCGGWGDRLKGMLSIAAMAMLTGRVFIVDSWEDGLPLGTFYDNASVPIFDYKMGVSIPDRTKRGFNCMNDATCECVPNNLGLLGNPGVPPSLDLMNSFEEVEFRTNSDCTNATINLPLFRDIARRLKFIGDSDNDSSDPDPPWQSQVFAAFFRPLPVVIHPVTRVLQLDDSKTMTLAQLAALEMPTVSFNVDKSDDKTDFTFEQVGIHIRSGLNPNDRTNRFSGSFESLLDSYASCLEYVRERHRLSAEMSRIFIAADTNVALEGLKTRAQKNGWHVVTAESLGEIGHIERNREAKDFIVRMHAEFELLRLSKYIIIGKSSFSRMAFLTRLHEREEGFLGVENCTIVH